jgi:hypothetical protein
MDPDVEYLRWLANLKGSDRLRSIADRLETLAEWHERFKDLMQEGDTDAETT